MIEIIREEEWNQTEKRELPKDIKQIGSPDIGDRIYMENQVYQFLHPYDSMEEKAAYVLLGRFENYAGRQCIFVEAAIRLVEMTFDGEMPLWNDLTWAYIYKQLKKEFDSMVIVGWAMDIRGSLPGMTGPLEQLHQNNFGGVHQILFLMDTLEQEEFFYGSRNGHLYQREGFYIYYDKSSQGAVGQLEPQPEQEQEFTEAFAAEEHEQTEAEMANQWYTGEGSRREGGYRKQVLEQEKQQGRPSYASTFFLAVVVCALGITAFFNYQKMNAMEETLAQMQGGKSRATTEMLETETEDVRVENVAGNVAKAEETAGGESSQAVEGVLTDQTTGNVAASADASGAAAGSMTQESGTATDSTAQASGNATGETADTATGDGASETANTGTTDAASAQTATDTSDTAATAATTEAQKYLEQGYYIVQKGDSLVGICRKIYQTTAMMDKICELNGIEDQDSIYAGQYLTLPN